MRPPSAFVVAQRMPEGFIRRTIYVRSTGDDATGRGTAIRPYATLTQALRALPHYVDDGRGITIDVTGINERVTAPILLPPFQSNAPFTVDFNPPRPWLVFMDGLNIIAEPTALFTLAAPTQTHDAVTGLVSLQVDGAGWTPGQWKGSLVWGSGLYELGVVASNTTDTLETTNAFGLTPPVTVGRPSATIEFVGVNPDLLVHTMTLEAPGFGLTFYGVALVNRQGDLYNNSASMGPGKRFTFVLSMLDGIEIRGGQSLPPYFDGCYFRSGKQIFIDGAEPGLRWTYIEGADFRQYGGGGLEQYFVSGCILDGCTPLGHGGNNEVDMPYEINSVVIRHSQGPGLQYFGGARSSFARSRIENSNGPAILAQGPGRLTLAGPIEGTGNARYGVEVQDGAHVIVKGALPAVTGALGDYKLPSLPVGTWAMFSPAFDPTDGSLIGPK